MDFNPSASSRVVVRATNWLGDAVMSLPAIRAIRGVFPRAHLAVVARPWVADLYARERCIDRRHSLCREDVPAGAACVCRAIGRGAIRRGDPAA